MIARILDSEEPVITVTWVVREVGVAAKRAQILLSFMKGKGLVKEVKAEVLPKPYSSFPSRRYLKVSNKGDMFLSKYRELAQMIK